METLLRPSTSDRTADKRLRVPWGKKAVPLKTSALFSKSKHSEEWHHSIDATAGVLHPSDPKLPYGFLRNHTDTYLRKKGKASQADTDIRLAVLVTSHDARDVAVAAAAHAMTAQSLRALLHADLNVMQGSYWGLKMWLQTLIAANSGNPASVTDLEALWARKLLPFAIQGTRAAEWYLAGICRALRAMQIPSMDILPVFSALTTRAIADYSTQLDGHRLRNEWTAAYEVVRWMVELARTSPVATRPGHVLPEHILDSQLPAWRVWTHWKPNLDLIKLFASGSVQKLSVVSDLVALEGPDIITGVKSTLRNGLVSRRAESRTLLRWRGIIIEDPGRSKKSLHAILARITNLLKMALAASGPGHLDMFELFRDLVLSKPVTTCSLEILEATFQVPYTPENDIYCSVREVYNDRHQLGGQHILAIQGILHALKDQHSADLHNVMLQDWFRQGIDACLQDCQKAVLSHIGKRVPWPDLILEYYTFCTLLKASKYHCPLPYQVVGMHSQTPSLEDMKIIMDIYATAQAQRSHGVSQTAIAERIVDEAGKQTKQTPTRAYIPGDDKCAMHPLEAHIELYCIDQILGGEPSTIQTGRAVKAILNVWKNTAEPHIDVDRRQLAVLVAKITDAEILTLGCGCLADIASGQLNLGPVSPVKDLLFILRRSESELPQAIVELTNLLASSKQWSACWKDLLYFWICGSYAYEVSEGRSLLEHLLKTMKAAQWLSFMDSIESLFIGPSFSGSVDSNTTPPAILHTALLEWKTRVSNYTGTLTRFETALEKDSGPVYCLLTCYSKAKDLVVILDCLQKAENKPVEMLMQKLVSKLLKNAENSTKIKKCFLDLVAATSGVVDTCLRIWDAANGWLDIPGLPEKATTVDHISLLDQRTTRKPISMSAKTPSQFVEEHQDMSKPISANEVLLSRRKVPPSVVEVMVAGLIQDDDINDRDVRAITSVASVLDICVEPFTSNIWKQKLTEAAKFWEGIETEILTEATRLETLQRVLKAKDPKGTTTLLQELGIPTDSLLDEEIRNLPAGVTDAVEKVGDAEVEISFPSTAFTELQRSAMGIPNGANNLLLRLVIHDEAATPPSFCLHFNNDDDLGTLEDEHWNHREDCRSRYNNSCTTSQTAFIWQLHQYIHTRFLIGNVGIASLHKLITDRLPYMGRMCIACGDSHYAGKAQLRRATPCNLLACTKLWYKLPLNVRVPEIRTDIYAVDLMLTSVYAAAMSGRRELLPSCPISNTETVKTILNSLPSLMLISHAVNISAVLRSYHEDAEKLISWACVQHRGYITTARGLCKIPTLPTGTHQFVLANASPKLESDFISKFPTPNAETNVLFHGTTFDRLPAILAQGLKVCSGTSLQRTGAAYGRGIYLAEEPATSLRYASATTSWRNSGLCNMKLLLGCEVIDVGKSVSKSIHVVTDKSSVMVRYILLLPNDASAPIANHVVPAMAIGMRALRTGAV
jgi:hypothetical protein